MRSEPRLNKPDDWGIVPGPLNEGDAFPEDTRDELDARLAPEMLDGDESGLPADLFALAGQLRSEAVLLGEKYPAEKGDREPRPVVALAEPVSAPASQPSQMPRWIAGTALVALIAAGLAWWSARPGSDAPPSVAVDAKAQPAERAPISVAMQPRDAAPADPITIPDDSTPALMLRDLSGPELEGLLDLLEQDALKTTGKPRLSI